MLWLKRHHLIDLIFLKSEFSVTFFLLGKVLFPLLTLNLKFVFANSTQTCQGCGYLESIWLVFLRKRGLFLSVQKIFLNLTAFCYSERSGLGVPGWLSQWSVVDGFQLLGSARVMISGSDGALSSSGSTLNGESTWDSFSAPPLVWELAYSFSNKIHL